MKLKIVFILLGVVSAIGGAFCFGMLSDRDAAFPSEDETLVRELRIRITRLESVIADVEAGEKQEESRAILTASPREQLICSMAAKDLQGKRMAPPVFGSLPQDEQKILLRCAPSLVPEIFTPAGDYHTKLDEAKAMLRKVERRLEMSKI